MSSFAAVADGWWSWAVPMSAQLAVLGAVLVLAEVVLRRWGWPQLRAALWLLVPLKLLLPPTLVSPLGLPGVAAGLPAAVTGAPAGSTTLGAAVFCCWLAGVLLFAVLAARRYRSERRDRLLAPAVPSPAWLADLVGDCARRARLAPAPEVRVVRDARGPAVIGFVRVVVVLPAELVETATRSELQLVLLHELSHVRRRDPIANLACVAAQIACWFHPVVWLARVRLSLLREICCDQAAVAALGISGPQYRDTLLRLARPLLARPAARGGIPFIPLRSQLVARIESLGRAPAPLAARPRLQRAVTAAIFAVLSVSCLPLARPASTPAEFVLPPPAELEGCLQPRFAVQRMLALEQRAAADRATSTTR